MTFTTHSSDQGVAGPAVPRCGQSGRCRGTPFEHSGLPDGSDDRFHIVVGHPPRHGQNGRCFPTPSFVKGMTRGSSKVVCQKDDRMVRPSCPSATRLPARLRAFIGSPSHPAHDPKGLTMTTSKPPAGPAIRDHAIQRLYANIGPAAVLVEVDPCQPRFRLAAGLPALRACHVEHLKARQSCAQTAPRRRAEAGLRRAAQLFHKSALNRAHNFSPT